ncbi:MAG: xanthine dehydrogenase family protein molybdopterin-binding subunit [Actinobacteria bacterium]|nr:xanthine dehydrogenase family protein molybdopterin-binding subunit [Actinomycetota bacterium]
MPDAPEPGVRPHPALAGSGRYTDDQSRPDQVYMAVVRSDAAHGRLLGLDVSAALALPGVVRVVVPDDLDPMPHIPIRTASLPELERCLQPVLPLEEIRYVGQPVAAVIAEDPALAEDAAERVRLEVQPLAVTGFEEPGWEETEPLLKMEAEQGQVEESFAVAAHVVRRELRIRRRTGAPIETRGILAEWQATDGVLQLWGPAKFIWFTRGVIAAALGITEDHVICHRVDVGGMFGTRGELYPEDVLAAWAAREVGRPVKWIEDRREHLLAMNQSAEELHRFELAVAADGELLAYRDEVVLDMGAYPRPIGSRIPALVIENLPGPYRWRASEVKVAWRTSNKAPVGTVRAPTRVASNFVREHAIDLAAAAVGLDRLELRRRNLITPAELPFERVLDEHETVRYEGGDYPALMDELFDAVGGPVLDAAVADRRAAGELVGIGLATILEGSGIGQDESAAITLERSGRFRVRTTASEVGQGLDETLRRVAAERLDVPADLVDVESGSSFAPPGGRGTYGSRSTVFAGASVDAACTGLLEELRTKAAAALGGPTGEIRFDREGAKRGRRRIDWVDLGPTEAEGAWSSDGPTFGFGMFVAIARVDRDTGFVTLERMTVAFDCGRAIYPAGVEGQLRGGAVQGISAALLEAVDYGAGGQPQSTSLVEYMLPTCADVPRIDVRIWESGEVTANPLGVRGPGEVGTAGAPAAVASAVADALGGRAPVELPITPEAVLALIDEIGEPTLGQLERGAAC